MKTQVTHHRHTIYMLCMAQCMCRC